MYGLCRKAGSNRNRVNKSLDCLQSLILPYDPRCTRMLTAQPGESTKSTKGTGVGCIAWGCVFPPLLNLLPTPSVVFVLFSGYPHHTKARWPPMITKWTYNLISRWKSSWILFSLVSVDAAAVLRLSSLSSCSLVTVMSILSIQSSSWAICSSFCLMPGCKRTNGFHTLN